MVPWWAHHSLPSLPSLLTEDMMRRVVAASALLSPRRLLAPLAAPAAFHRDQVNYFSQSKVARSVSLPPSEFPCQHCRDLISSLVSCALRASPPLDANHLNEHTCEEARGPGHRDQGDQHYRQAHVPPPCLPWLLLFLCPVWVLKKLS